MRTSFIAMLLVLAGAGTARAEGFAIYDYGARGSALGGAMLARRPDASAVAHNPALVTGLEGTWFMAGVTAIAAGGRVDRGQGGGGGRTEAEDSVSLVPHAYFTRQLNERWFFGIGGFTRFGLGVRYPQSWPGRFNLVEVELATVSVNPVIAWKATDRLSLAVGAEFMHASLDMKKRVEVPIGPGQSFEAESDMRGLDGTGVGFNLAAHYRLNGKWALGLHYRSRVRISAAGRAGFRYLGPDIQAAKDAFAAGFTDGAATAAVTFPDSLAAGVAFSPVPDMTLEIGAAWTGWSSYESLDIGLPGGMGVSRNPAGWKDAWRVTAGAEYDALEWLSLRAGYSRDGSPMTGGHADYTVPTGGRHTYSLGLGLRLGGWTLDMAYLRVNCLSRDYRDSPVQAGGNGTVGSTGRFRAAEWALSAGYGF